MAAIIHMAAITGTDQASESGLFFAVVVAFAVAAGSAAVVVFAAVAAADGGASSLKPLGAGTICKWRFSLA
jgi:hypothetical protein